MDKNAEYCIYIALNRTRLENKFHSPTEVVTETKEFLFCIFYDHICFVNYSVHIMAVHVVNRQDQVTLAVAQMNTLVFTPCLKGENGERWRVIMWSARAVVLFVGQ